MFFALSKIVIELIVSHASQVSELYTHLSNVVLNFTVMQHSITDLPRYDLKLYLENISFLIKSLSFSQCPLFQLEAI